MDEENDGARDDAMSALRTGPTEPSTGAWPPSCRWAAAAMVAAAASCSHAQPVTDEPPLPEIIEIGTANYSGPPGSPLESACREWRLSNSQAAAFFQLSQQYDQPPYAAFYQVPCAISGTLQADGKIWNFVIGGGGTATWSHIDQRRHFGCSADACRPLILLPTDLGKPDQ